MSVPRATPLAKNWTLATVRGATAPAVAVTVAAELTASDEPVAGAVTEAVGWLPPVTVMATAAEVPVAARSSVATAVSE